MTEKRRKSVSNARLFIINVAKTFLSCVFFRKYLFFRVTLVEKVSDKKFIFYVQ